VTFEEIGRKYLFHFQSLIGIYETAIIYKADPVDSLIVFLCYLDDTVSLGFVNFGKRFANSVQWI